MNTMLWVCQYALALVFLLSGILKGTQSKAWLVASGQTGVAALSLREIRLIAVCELLGAVGLIAPWALHVIPILTPLAAVGLGMIMIFAARIHSRLRELRNASINVVLLIICAFVAVGRLRELIGYSGL